VISSLLTMCLVAYKTKNELRWNGIKIRNVWGILFLVYIWAYIPKHKKIKK
jgi:hypothetical protein